MGIATPAGDVGRASARLAAVHHGASRRVQVTRGDEVVYLSRVSNESVWHSLKLLFTAALLLFLINNYFGFDNAMTAGDIDRWQILIHLHGGSVGWITLSAIGIAIWVMTGERAVDAAYERRVRTLVWAAIVAFAGYVPAFGFAFSRPSGPLVAILPLFGALSVLVLWAATLYAFGELKRQSPTSTVHVLAAGALLTAAIGGTVGMLFGLERVLGTFLPLRGDDRIGAHAGMMDTYLFLVASAIVEWGLGGRSVRWTKAGLAQALCWMIGATLVPIAFFLDIVPQVLPIFGLLLLVGMAIFLVRVGRRALATMPSGAGVPSWSFFGTVWLVAYIGLFLYGVSQDFDFAAMPTWFGTVFAHVGFVGMMTNLLFGVLASRAQAGAAIMPWAEAAALWTTNLGLVVFAAGKVFADVRHGAWVMGVGVVLGVIMLLRRLRSS